jgi:hypothetical protein
MRRRTSLAFLALAALLLPTGLAGANPPGGEGTPPGFAKKYGPKRAGTVCVAFDRRHDGRAWFLVGGSWVLRSGFRPAVRAVVKTSLGLPPSPSGRRSRSRG